MTTSPENASHLHGSAMLKAIPARHRPLILKAGIILALSLLLLARVPEVLSMPQFWADEGSSFFRDAWCHGPASIFRHYSGYYHVIPRIFAFAATFFPPFHAPAIYCYSSIALTSLVLALLLSDRISLPFKPLLASAVVLVPHDGEVFANLTNIQWLLAIGLIAIIFMRPGVTRLSLFTDALYVLLAGMTGTYIVIFLPAFLARLWLDRCDKPARNRLLLLTAIALATATIQMYSVSYTNEDKIYQYPSLSVGLADIFNHLGNVVNLSAARVFGSAMESLLSLGQTGREPAVERILAFSLIMLVCFSLLLLYNMSRDRKHLFAQGVFIYLLAILLFAAFYRNSGLAATKPDTLILHASDRYFYIPKVMLCWLLILMLSTWQRSLVPLFFLAVIVTTSLRHFQRPPWQDLKWDIWASRISTGQPIKIPINPSGWIIDLTCKPK